MGSLSSDCMLFHNRMRVLMNIEASDLAAAGITDGAFVRRFMADPHQTFIRADDDTCRRLWSIVEARSSKRAA